jgi:hypothetical protein
LLPVPHYFSSYRPANEKYRQKDAELTLLAQEYTDAYVRMIRLTAKREKAQLERREADAKALQARETEAMQHTDEAQARRDTIRDNQYAIERAAISLAYVTAVWLVAISGLGMLLSLTAGLTVWLRGGLQVGLLSGLVVEVVIVGSIENVWWALIVRWMQTFHYFLTPMAAGVVGLIFGLICGWMTRSMKRRTID